MKRLLLMIVILMALSPAQGVDLVSRFPDPVPTEVEAMYVKGLNALVQFQQRAGNWNDGEGGGPGVVGLAILAMLAYRPYRDALDVGQTLEILVQGRDSLFDTAVVSACLNVFRKQGGDS